MRFVKHVRMWSKVHGAVEKFQPHPESLTRPISRLCLLRTLHVSRYEHVLTIIVDVDDTARLGLDYIHVAKSPAGMHSNPSECSRKVASRIAPGSSRKRRLETAPSASWRGRSHHVHS